MDEFMISLVCFFFLVSVLGIAWRTKSFKDVLMYVSIWAIGLGFVFLIEGTVNSTSTIVLIEKNPATEQYLTVYPDANNNNYLVVYYTRGKNDNIEFNKINIDSWEAKYDLDTKENVYFEYTEDTTFIGKKKNQKIVFHYPKEMLGDIKK